MEGHLFPRLASGARRRVRHAWNTLTAHQPDQSVPRAMDWLLRRADQPGLSPGGPRSSPCPGLTAAALVTLADYGQVARAANWVDWLLSSQLAEGAFSDACLVRPSLWNTALATDGLLALLDEVPRARSAIERAGQWLAERIDLSGRLAPPDERDSAFDHGLPRGMRVLGLPALCRAAQRTGRSDWRRLYERARQQALRQVQLETMHGPTHWLAAYAGAILELGGADQLRESAAWLHRLQHKSGAVGCDLGRPLASASTVATSHLADIWYQLGEFERADRALAWLRRWQRPSGGFMGSHGRQANYFPRQEAAWSAVRFLNTAQRQVACSFQNDRQLLPHDLDPADGRLRAVLDWADQFPPGAMLADVGCGSGRFLRQLAARSSAMRLVGIDPSQRALQNLPRGVEGRVGSLLRIPARNGSFDGVLAVESLEHSLLPERAVQELCRVVRPGGQILIIDKHRAHQPLSDCQPWEQWFQPEQVSEWLTQHCRQVRVRRIAHGAHRSPTGLFLCWHGLRARYASSLAA